MYVYIYMGFPDQKRVGTWGRLALYIYIYIWGTSLQQGKSVTLTRRCLSSGSGGTNKGFASEIGRLRFSISKLGMRKLTCLDVNDGC